MINQEFLEKWLRFSLIEQLAHVGSEVDRAIYWWQKNDTKTGKTSVDLALELLDLTIADARWRQRLKELLRTREVLADRFYGSNEYNTSDEFLKKYFLQFGLAAHKHR